MTPAGSAPAMPSGRCTARCRRWSVASAPCCSSRPTHSPSLVSSNTAITDPTRSVGCSAPTASSPRSRSAARRRPWPRSSARAASARAGGRFVARRASVCGQRPAPFGVGAHGARRLVPHGCAGAGPKDVDADAYVADMAVVGKALDVEDPPATAAQLRERLESFRPELDGSAMTRDVVRFLENPPLPLVARPYQVLERAAADLLPVWAHPVLGTLARPGPLRRLDVAGADALLRSLALVVGPRGPGLGPPVRASASEVRHQASSPAEPARRIRVTRARPRGAMPAPPRG